MTRTLIGWAVTLCIATAASPLAQQSGTNDYRVLATSKTSTTEKEMNAAAASGFRFEFIMGGETAVGGKEVVTIMSRTGGTKARYQYRLIATSKTSTMQKELQEASDAGFEYRAQTVFESLFGGKEVACILERDLEQPASTRYDYLLLATNRTSTMQKELVDAGARGYEAIGMTVAKTAIGGSELVTIMRKRLK